MTRQTVNGVNRISDGVVIEGKRNTVAGGAKNASIRRRIRERCRKRRFVESWITCAVECAVWLMCMTVALISEKTVVQRLQ